MSRSVLMAVLVAVGISGCSKSDAVDAQVAIARANSQQAAMYNAKAYLGRTYQNKYANLKCEADDDIEMGNLVGDGDADCQFQTLPDKKKAKIECSTMMGKGCKKEH